MPDKHHAGGAPADPTATTAHPDTAAMANQSPAATAPAASTVLPTRTGT